MNNKKESAKFIRSFLENNESSLKIIKSGEDIVFSIEGSGRFKKIWVTPQKMIIEKENNSTNVNINQYEYKGILNEISVWWNFVLAQEVQKNKKVFDNG